MAMTKFRYEAFSLPLRAKCSLKATVDREGLGQSFRPRPPTAPGGTSVRQPGVFTLVQLSSFARVSATSGLDHELLERLELDVEIAIWVRRPGVPELHRSPLRMSCNIVIDIRCHLVQPQSQVESGPSTPTRPRESFAGCTQ